MFQVVIAVLVIVLVARLILKGYRAEPVLFAAGLVLMAMVLAMNGLAIWLRYRMRKNIK